MDRSSLKLYCRGKGRLEDSSIKLSKDYHEISIKNTQNKDPTVTHDFHRVFIETPQEEVFEISTRPVLDHVLDGYDGLILLYGPTGSGKTFTLFGTESDKGIFYRVIQSALEDSDKIISTKEIQILATAIELFGTSVRDLGLAYKDPHAINIFPSQQLEISEINGRVSIPNACECLIKNQEEAFSFIHSINDMRVSLEAKQGKYVDKAHTILCLKLKQKFKGSSWDQFSESCVFLVELPGSEKPKERKGQEFYESLGATSSFHAIAKCLVSLNSITTHFSDHKITRILENAFRGNSMIALIGCISLYKECDDETLRTLSYMEKCRPLAGTANFGESANADFTIKILQDDRAALKEKLRKLEFSQEDQLKKLVEILGVESDIDNILQASAGSKDMQKLAAQREAVLKVDQLAKRNKELEKRAEENQKVFEKIKKMDFKKQEANLRQILETKDELNKLLEILEENKATQNFNIKTQIQTKTYEINEMLKHSEILLEEKIAIMNKLPKNLTSTQTLPDVQNVKELGKNEITKEYTKKLAEQGKNLQEHFECINKKFETQLQQRENMLEEVKNNYERYRIDKENEYEALKKETKAMFEVVKAQKKVIDNIKNGEYNQHMLKIDFPDRIIPEFPSEKFFPILYMEDKNKVAKGVVGKIKELKADIKRSAIEKKPQLFINIIELENDGPRKIVQELREIYKESVGEVEMVEEEEKKVKKELWEMKEKLQKALDEKFRFKELYISEIKKFNDARLYINNQKNMRKNCCTTSKIS